MAQERDRAWRRHQRARHIEHRVAEDMVPKQEPKGLVAIWQLHTPQGEPMPVFKRHQLADKEELGSQQVVRIRHRYGCPHYASFSWYTPVMNTCNEDCRPFPGLANRGNGHSWPEAPLGFIWKIIQVIDPEIRPWAKGKLDKNKRPKGKYQFQGVSGRIHILAASRGAKNWKMLYTRSVKVARASQLGKVYRRHRDYPEDED